MKCQDCNKEDDTVHETVCPFVKEIYDEEVQVIIRDNCYHERCMDI